MACNSHWNRYGTDKFMVDVYAFGFNRNSNTDKPGTRFNSSGVKTYIDMGYIYRSGYVSNNSGSVKHRKHSNGYKHINTYGINTG